jgi:small subunit ribosomal protein S20
MLDYTPSMPVTKTAKRALRSSKKKAIVNSSIKSKLETALRIAKKEKTAAKVLAAVKLADRAAKKKVIHKNKAARIKKILGRLKGKTSASKKKVAKTSKKSRSTRKK